MSEHIIANAGGSKRAASGVRSVVCGGYSCSVTIPGCSVTLGRPLSHYRKEVRCCSVTIRENIMQVGAFSWGHLTLQSALVTLQHFATDGRGSVRGAVRF